MRFFSILVLLALSASGVVTAFPVEQLNDLINITQETEDMIATEPIIDTEATIAVRDDAKATKAKHDANHKKQDAGNCGQGCKNSLSSYHSDASKKSKASKASQASKNSKNAKKKGGRSLGEAEVETEAEAGRG